MMSWMDMPPHLIPHPNQHFSGQPRQAEVFLYCELTIVQNADLLGDETSA